MCGTILASSSHKLCAFPDLLWLFAKCYFGLIRVHLRSVAQLTDDLTHHLLYKLDIGFISTGGRPSTFGIILNILTSFFESFVPEKSCWTRESLLFVDLLKHKERFRRTFYQIDQKFEVGSLLCYHYKIVEQKHKICKMTVNMLPIFFYSWNENVIASWNCG